MGDGKTSEQEAGKHEGVTDTDPHGARGKDGKKKGRKKHSYTQCGDQKAECPGTFVKAVFCIYRKKNVQRTGDKTVKGHHKEKRKEIVFLSEYNLVPLCCFPEKKTW